MKPSLVKETLKSLFAAYLPVMLAGAPGVGKSDIVAQAAEEAGFDMILSHPAVADPTDAKGLPWPDAEANVAKFLPFGDLAKAMNATQPTLWFLDDLGQATPAVQASYMQLLLARRVNDHVLPDCVTFVAATNRRQDRAGVQGILEPVKSRVVTILEVEPDLDSWCQWAFAAEMPVEVIAFLRLRPDLLHSFRPTAEMTNSESPRTWSHVGRMLKAKLPVEAEFECFKGAVGEASASEFTGFVRIMREIPDPDAVLITPDKAMIPEKPSALYALTTALVYRVNEQNFGRYLTYAERLFKAEQGEFAALMVRDALNVCPEVQQTPAFIKMVTGELGQVLNG